MNSNTKGSASFLSPHLSGKEQTLVADGFASDGITLFGLHVDAFEVEFAEQVGAEHAVALASIWPWSWPGWGPGTRSPSPASPGT